MAVDLWSRSKYQRLSTSSPIVRTKSVLELQISNIDLTKRLPHFCFLIAKFLDSLKLSSPVVFAPAARILHIGVTAQQSSIADQLTSSSLFRRLNRQVEAPPFLLLLSKRLPQALHWTCSIAHSPSPTWRSHVAHPSRISPARHGLACKTPRILIASSLCFRVVFAEKSLDTVVQVERTLSVLLLRVLQ